MSSLFFFTMIYFILSNSFFFFTDLEPNPCQSTTMLIGVVKMKPYCARTQLVEHEMLSFQTFNLRTRTYTMAKRSSARGFTCLGFWLHISPQDPWKLGVLVEADRKCFSRTWM